MFHILGANLSTYEAHFARFKRRQARIHEVEAALEPPQTHPVFVLDCDFYTAPGTPINPSNTTPGEWWLRWNTAGYEPCCHLPSPHPARGHHPAALATWLALLS